MTSSLFIHEHGDLKGVTEAQLRAQRLDEGALFDSEQLRFDGPDHFTLVNLLNEDLFTGRLRGKRREVDRKSPRG
jgi:hypothetical protein